MICWVSDKTCQAFLKFYVRKDLTVTLWLACRIHTVKSSAVRLSVHRGGEGPPWTPTLNHILTKNEDYLWEPFLRIPFPFKLPLIYHSVNETVSGLRIFESFKGKLCRRENWVICTIFYYTEIQKGVHWEKLSSVSIQKIQTGPYGTFYVKMS